jgi:RNA polymerase sigma-70 factor (ECF subfamily)
MEETGGILGLEEFSSGSATGPSLLLEAAENRQLEEFMVVGEGYSLVLSGIEERRSEQIDLAALLETYSSLLFRLAYSILRSRHDAEEVVQDTFVRVLEHRASLPAVRDMRAWLVKVAWNQALDRKRRVRPEQLDAEFAESLVSVSVPADRALDEAQRMKAVLEEMELLPRAERNVLLLSAVEEMDHKAMAELLGKSESAVRALLFRARTRLRERLEKRAKKIGGKR